MRVDTGRVLRHLVVALVLPWLLVVAPPRSFALGVSPYLPLNLEPETERQIERVLILGDKPILRRPIAAATVLDALPKACAVDAALCERVRAYLRRYMGDYAVTHASVTAAATSGSDPILPNQRGLASKDAWQVSADAYIQPSDYLLANLGGVAYKGRTVPTGSVLSVGWSGAQLDIGWRDHWMSPLTDSSMLPSTEAPTTPGITLSNYEPFSRLKIEYEIFLTRLSESHDINFNGRLSTGYPHLAGFHLGIEPVTGWTFGVNRVLEYGGGFGQPSSAHFLLSDFFKPSGTNQNLGNQQASYVSRFLYPGKTPFAVYFEYAGEDNSNGGSYLLGNAALSAGIDLPRLWDHFDATIEASEWQNIWYIHGIYGDGMTNDGIVLGHWGAEDRQFGDGVGAHALMARLGWETPTGGYLEGRARTVANEHYYGTYGRSYAALIAPVPYHRAVEASVRYSQPVGSYTAGGEFVFGKDVYGSRYTRLDGFLRLGASPRRGYTGIDDEPAGSVASIVKGLEVFADVGASGSTIRTNVEPNLPSTTSGLKAGPHVTLGARRAVTKRNDVGMALDLDQIDGHTAIGVRAIDFRHRFGQHLAVGAFAGAVDWRLATPALSMFAGLTAQARNVCPGWDVGVDFKYSQNVARDHVLASDVQGVRPETFYKITTVSVYLSRHF